MDKQTLKRSHNPNEKKADYGKLKKRVIEYIKNDDKRLRFTPCPDRNYDGNTQFKKVWLEDKFEGVVMCDNKSCNEQVYR